MHVWYADAVVLAAAAPMGHPLRCSVCASVWSRQTDLGAGRSRGTARTGAGLPATDSENHGRDRRSARIFHAAAPGEGPHRCRCLFPPTYREGTVSSADV